MSSELWQRIRAVRKHMELNQEKFGALLGVSKAAVSLWESENPESRNRPVHETLEKIASSSGAPLEWLLSDSSDCDKKWWADQKPETNSHSPLALLESQSFFPQNQQTSRRDREAFIEEEVAAILESSLTNGAEFSIAYQSFFSDMSIVSINGNAICRVEIKTMTVYRSRLMRFDIDRLIGGLWRMSLRRDAVIPMALVIVFILPSPADLEQPFKPPNDFTYVMEEAVKRGLLYDYAVVGYQELPAGASLVEVGPDRTISKLAARVSSTS